MGQVKEINIKIRGYYFCDGMINIKNCHSDLLKIDKKLHEDIDIYYISYIMIKKFSDCKNNHSVNLLYLINRPATGHFKENYREKYLIIASTEKYEEIWSKIKSETKNLDGRKELFYEKNYARIGINTDDDLPLNKQLKVPTLAIIIRCVLQNDEKFYPQIYLDECFYELVV